MSETLFNRVNAAIRRLGYVPHVTARRLRTGRARLVGAMTPSLIDQGWAVPLAGIVEACERQGYGVVVYAHQGVDAREIAYARSLVHGQAVDGLILIFPRSTSEVIQSLGRTAIPHVTVYPRQGDFGSACVEPADRAGAKQAVEHLAELGHRRIAHFMGPSEHRTAWERLTGFQDGMHAARCRVEEALLLQAQPPDELVPMDRIRRLLSSPHAPTAVVCWDDRIASQTIEAAREVGLRVPEQLSVVGFNDELLAQYTDPRLTTLRQPWFDMGGVAAELVLAQIEGRPVTQRHRVLPVELVRRGSTAPAPNRSSRPTR